MTDKRFRTLIFILIASSAMIILSTLMLLSISFNGDTSSITQILFGVVLVLSVVGLIVSYIMMMSNPKEKKVPPYVDQSTREDTVFVNLNRYKDLPSYSGKDTFLVTRSKSSNKAAPTVLSILYFGVIFTQFNFSKQNLYRLAVISAVMLFLIIMILIATAKRRDNRVIITSYGVQSIILELAMRNFLRWEEIESIRILTKYKNKKGKYICFTPKKREMDFYDYNSSDKPYNIIIQYKPKIIHYILEHWDKDITGLEDMKSWNRYAQRVCR